MLGFTPAGAADERALWSSGSTPASRPPRIRERLRRMAAEANQVGSPHDSANAEFTLEQFKAWGWDAHIETFSVLYPTPKAEALELVTPTRFAATLTEPRDGRHLGAHPGRAAGLVRLRRRGRCHRAAGLCELRHARGLRAAPARSGWM